MNGLFKYISPFAPDQSGATAVLFSLGGIVVICDAGGCAGNICGFDEPRWFTEKSAVFSAGLRDIDAILGRDERLVQKLEETIHFINAKFAAIVGTPVPAVIGTDFRALRRMAEARLGIPVVALDTTGIGLYDEGEEKAYIALLSAFAQDRPVCRFETGVFGATPLNMPYKGYENELKAMIEARYGKVSLFSGESGIDDLKNAGAAKLNIAVSVSGIKACEYLKQRFGTEYRVEFPLEKFGKSITNDVLRMTYEEKQKAVKNEESLLAPAKLDKRPRTNGETSVWLPAYAGSLVKNTLAAGCSQKEKKPFSAGCDFCSSAESSGFEVVETLLSAAKDAGSCADSDESRRTTDNYLRDTRCEVQGARCEEQSAKDTGSCADSDESRRKTDNYLRDTRCEVQGARYEERKSNNELPAASSGERGTSEEASQLPAANAPTLIMHQQVLANSVRAKLEAQGGTADVATWFKLNRNYARQNDVQLREEDAFFALLAERKYSRIIADPIFGRMLADFEGEFIPLCHYACSGELFAGGARENFEALCVGLEGENC